MLDGYIVDEFGNLLGWHKHEKYGAVPDLLIHAEPPESEDGFIVWSGTEWQVKDHPAGPDLDVQRIEKIRSIDALRDAILIAGVMHQSGSRIRLTDGSRADLGGMATTALGCQVANLPWPENYSRGWITVENSRVPLPEPQDGLMLAAFAGAAYAAVVQHARDLKDAVSQAIDQAALDAIDIESGWPS